MKFACAFIGVVISALAATSVSHGRDFPVLEGPYMGQPGPGMTAKVFAPGIVSTEAWEVEAVFAPGMHEFYFTQRAANTLRAPLSASARKTISGKNISSSRGTGK